MPQWWLFQEQSAKSLEDLLLTENTTVLLMNYTVGGGQNGVAAITEVVLDEDHFHSNDFVAVPSSMLVAHRITVKESHLVIPFSDNAITLNERYVYMLVGSAIDYTICAGNASEPSSSMFYAFNTEQSYNNYLSSFSLVTPDSIFSHHIEIGGKDSIKCTSFTFHVNSTSFYFFALKARYANTRVKYDLSASINTLFLKDYANDYNGCSINSKDSMSCSIEAGTGEWSIIGFSQNSYSFNSHLNHVQISVDQKYSSSLHYGLLGMCFGGVVLIGVGLLFIVVFVVAYFIEKRKR